MKSINQLINKQNSLLRYTVKAIKLVWETNSKLALILFILNFIAGVMPAIIAFLGKLIIDSILLASKTGLEADINTAIKYLVLEAIVVIALSGIRRGLNVCETLLRALLGQKVNTLILEKAITLELSHFEDSEFYDKMTRARREASSRPLSLVKKTFNLIQNIISLSAFAALLLSFSKLAVLILIIASIPPFIAETKFAGDAFRLFSWRVPEAREQMYLETLIAREDSVKEVKLYQLGKKFLDRYKNIFNNIYSEERKLTIKKGVWVYFLGLLSTLAFYGTYAWIILETIRGNITLGDMTMYITVFRQGQSTFTLSLTAIGGMYEDALYLSNLYEFLDEEVKAESGQVVKGINNEGLRFENVSFTYFGGKKPAIENVNLQIKPGEKLAIVGENGAGKTTLISLLTRLYSPTGGKIYLDGVDLEEWDINSLHKRIGVIFQNFVRYQFKVGENIGVGDIENFSDKELWDTSAEKGLAKPFIEDLSDGYETQLGRWFKGGQELSGGQWQKIALSRSFMREKADILILDEPTSAMDAEAEYKIFEHFRKQTKEKMVLLISHRFSTVRMADKIIVMDKGKLIEEGSHDELIHKKGTYEKLFSLQAQGYK